MLSSEEDCDASMMSLFEPGAVLAPVFALIIVIVESSSASVCLFGGEARDEDRTRLPTDGRVVVIRGAASRASRGRRVPITACLFGRPPPFPTVDIPMVEVE